MSTVLLIFTFRGNRERERERERENPDKGYVQSIL